MFVLVAPGTLTAASRLAMASVWPVGSFATRRPSDAARLHWVSGWPGDTSCSDRATTSPSEPLVHGVGFTASPAGTQGRRIGSLSALSRLLVPTDAPEEPLLQKLQIPNIFLNDSVVP